MRRLLLNRFVLAPAAIAVVVLLWNVYVAIHNNGVVEGRVVDSGGRPVAGARVALWTWNFTTYEERAHVETDAEGVFRFTGNPSHRIQVSADKPGVGRSARVPVFLYFRSQDVDLAAPLRLSSG